MKQYLFGYGSLVNKASAAVSGFAGELYGAQIKGYQRRWQPYIHVDPPFQAVTLVKHVEAFCSGVLLELPAGQLQRFDEREYGYDRHLVPHSDIIVTTVEIKNDDLVWVYALPQHVVTKLDKTIPLVHSYLDVILAGLYEVGGLGAIDLFVDTTVGWGTIIDDHQTPRYIRPQAKPPEHKLIWHRLETKLATTLDSKLVEIDGTAS